MPKTLTYRVKPGPSRDGGYSVLVPALPGCVSEGESYDEALESIREAIRGWLEVAIVCEAAEGLGDDIPAGDVLTETVEVSVSPPQVDDMEQPSSTAGWAR